MFNGYRLYKLHKEQCAAWDLSVPAWEALSTNAQNEWEIKAYEQNLRDRDGHASVPPVKRFER